MNLQGWIIFVTAVLTTYILFSAVDDAERIRKNKPINHTAKWFVRAFIVSLQGGVIATSGSIELYTVYLLTAAIYFWLLFDLTLNWLRGLPTLYAGKPGNYKSSKIDKLFWRLFPTHPGLYMMIIKLLLLGSLITIFINIYDKIK